MGEKLERISDLTAADIKGWDRFLGRGNKSYDDILKYLEVESLHGYFNRYFNFVNEKQNEKMDDIYGVVQRDVFVLVDDENKVLAFTFIQFQDALCDEENLYIQSIVVNPTKRGKGYGKKLLSKLILSDEILRERKIRNISAVVENGNLSSLKLFCSFGGGEIKRVGKYIQYVADFDTVKESLKNQFEEQDEM